MSKYEKRDYAAIRVAANPARAKECICCNKLDTKIAKGMCNICYSEKKRRELGCKKLVRVSKEHTRLRQREWDRRNSKDKYQKAKSKEGYRESRQRSYQKNKASYVTRAYNRYMKRKQHTLKNVTYKDLQVFYEEARKLTEETGIVHNVDHIIPIKNDLVCGLNVPWNLQILTEFENKSKKNKFDGTNNNESWKL